MSYCTSILNSPILVSSMLITILDVQLFCPRIGISTDPLLIIWRVETFAWTLSFVESIINEKGSKPSYGCQSLSLIPSVSVATSQRCSGDLETIVRVISFCVMKCLAISLTLVKSRVNILSIESLIYKFIINFIW